MKIQSLLFAASAAIFAGTAAVTPSRETSWEREASSEATAVVDWSRATGSVQRPLFSLQGFMQVYSQPDPMVLETFELLNPQGTQTRLETYIHQMEPENDNGDPAAFNWDKLKPQEMIRFIKDRDAFEEVYWQELGMEPLSLLCYQVDWNRSGNEDDPIQSKEEWAEFAAAVIESYNGSGKNYRPRMRLAQIWNEPNMKMFYTGTPESYYELFNTVADRIHREYPGVMVGGPTITHSGIDPEEFMDGFIRECGENADFIIFHHYGPQGEGYQVLVDSARRYAEEFRQIPGKENGQVMITETDAWFQGWPKIQFLLGRQFSFIDIDHLLMAVHHFSALAYDESGNYVFGVVDEQGGAIEAPFWTYWLFRNYIGDKVHTQRQGSRQGDFQLAASRHEQDGSRISTAILHNTSSGPLTVDTLLFFEPEEHDRVLVSNRVSPGFKGVEKAEEIPPGQGKRRLALNMAPGEAVSLNLQKPGQRHFAFRDLNNQEQPWIGLTANRSEAAYGDDIVFRIRLLNTTQGTLNGEIILERLPDQWEPEILTEESSMKVNDLQFGETHEVAIRANVSSLLEEGLAAPFAWLRTKEHQTLVLDEVAHSIATTVEVNDPASVQPVPATVYTVPGVEELHLDIQVTRKTEETVEGTVTVEFPPGIGSNPLQRFSVSTKDERKRYPVTYAIAPETEPGAYQGIVTLTVLGTHIRRPFTIQVENREPVEGMVPVDLSNLFNFDAFSFYTNRRDYDGAMGNFSFPADFLPSGRLAKVHGYEFLMPSLEDGGRNSILPEGRKILVPEDAYRKAVLIGFGLDGKHPGEWVLHYTDGSREKVSSEIPEWCITPPEGTLEAFPAPHRHTAGGTAPPACQLWLWAIPMDKRKRLAAIEMPSFEHGGYIQALSLVKAE